MKATTLMQTRPRGFTLPEMMIASVLAFILVAAGAELTAAMARNVKRAEEQGDLGVRAALGHAFISDLLSAAAYNWNTTQTYSTGVTSGSLGAGACVSATGMCTATGQIDAPLRICNGATVDKATCNAPSATTSDALWSYVPRDGLIEAMSIDDRSGTALTDSCNTTNVPSPITLSVRGANSQPWAANDLVLVSRNGHSTIGVVTANFAAGTDATVSRDLTIDVGGGNNLANDDGGSSFACDARTSLRNSKIMRIRQIVLKQDPATRTLQFGARESATAELVFSNILSDVDDLQIQLDLARIPTTGNPSICTSNTTAVFGGAAIGNGACATDRLNGDPADGNVVRVVGLRVGLLLSTAVETQSVAVTSPPLFDRTTTFNDKRIRRTSLIYVGLPNAANL